LTRLSARWNATEARLCEIGQGATASGGEPDVILCEFGFLENGSLTEVGTTTTLRGSSSTATTRSRR
jgi:hypothetical protein